MYNVRHAAENTNLWDSIHYIVDGDNILNPYKLCKLILLNHSEVPAVALYSI